MSYQIVLSKCLIKISHQKISSKCLIKMSNQNISLKCLVKMSHQNVSSICINKCLFKMFHQNVLSKCLIKMSDQIILLKCFIKMFHQNVSSKLLCSLVTLFHRSPTQWGLRRDTVTKHYQTSIHHTICFINTNYSRPYLPPTVPACPHILSGCCGGSFIMGLFLPIYMGGLCMTVKWPNPGLFNSKFGRSLQRESE